MFGTQMTDEFFAVHTGGDVAFLNGVLKVLLADGTIDRDVRARAHRGVRRAARRARARVVRRARAAVGRDARRHGALRPHVRAAPVGGARVVDGHHPARARRRQRRRDRQPRARARQRRPAGRRPDADPRPLRRAGRRRDGRVRHRASPAASPIDAAVGGRARRARTASRSATGPGSPPRRWSRPARRGELDVLYSSGGNFLEVLPDPDRGRATRSAACRCASTRTSSCRARCSSTPATSSCCSRPRRATSSAAAAPRPPPSAGSRSAPRSPGRQVGEARSEWEIFVDLAQRVDPARAAPRRLRVGRGDPRRDRDASCPLRGRRDACAPPATRSSGAARGSAKAASSRRPTARRTSRRFAAHVDADVPDGQSFRAQHPAGQAVQHDGARRARPAHRRDARRAVHGADRRRRARARRRRPVVVRSDARRDAGARARRSDAARQRAGVLPRGQRAPARSAVATRRRASPTTTRSSPWSRRVSPDELLDVFDVARPTRSAARSRTLVGRPTGAAAPTARAVPPRPRGRRRDPPRAPRGRAAGAERGVGLDRRPDDAAITVVLDPVDGSTNCARGIPYWAISLCALDADGPLCSPGAERRDRRARTPRSAARARGSTARRSRRRRTTDIERAVVALSGLPRAHARRGGSSARSARRRSRSATSPPGTSTATSTASADQHAPWDYLGGAARVPGSGRDRGRRARARARRRRRRRPPPAPRRRHARAARRAASRGGR